MEGGRKEKDAWREEGRRRMIGERKDGEEWREKGRQERRKKLRNEVKKGTPTLFYKVFCFTGLDYQTP